MTGVGVLFVLWSGTRRVIFSFPKLYPSFLLLRALFLRGSGKSKRLFLTFLSYLFYLPPSINGQRTEKCQLVKLSGKKVSLVEILLSDYQVKVRRSSKPSLYLYLLKVPEGYSMSTFIISILTYLLVYLLTHLCTTETQSYFRQEIKVPVCFSIPHRCYSWDRTVK